MDMLSAVFISSPKKYHITCMIITTKPIQTGPTVFDITEAIMGENSFYKLCRIYFMLL